MKCYNVHGKDIVIEQCYRPGFGLIKIHYPHDVLSGKFPNIVKFLLLVLVIICLFLLNICPVVLQKSEKIFAWMLLSCCAASYVYFNNCYISEESVMFVKNLGLQLSTEYYFGKIKEEFLPLKSIMDVGINEAIYMHRIIYVLLILINEPIEHLNSLTRTYSKATRSVLLFKGTKPRLKELSLILNRIHEVLLCEEDGKAIM